MKSMVPVFYVSDVNKAVRFLFLVISAARNPRTTIQKKNEDTENERFDVQSIDMNGAS
jgi:hypothetical protein